jgi:hypothetical protein
MLLGRRYCRDGVDLRLSLILLGVVLGYCVEMFVPGRRALISVLTKC